MYKSSSATRQRREVSINPFVQPALALTPFWPASPAAAPYAQAIEGFDKIATEWLDFVRRRLDADIGLTTRVATARCPMGAWDAYAEFLRQAVQDYSNEYVAMNKLTTDVLRGPTTSVEEPKHEGADKALPRQQAA